LTLKNKKLYALFFSLIILLDQVSKYLVQNAFSLDPYKTIGVIDNFFIIRFVKNKGAVWGMFSQSAHTIIPKVITGLSIVALAAVLYFFLKMETRCKLELFALSAIIGGAVGNIIDRLYQGYVVDFLDFFISSHHWPTFNVADMFISIGVFFLIISIWRGKCTQF